MDYQGIRSDLAEMRSRAMLWAWTQDMFGHRERAQRWLDFATECLEFERITLSRIGAA